MDMPGASRVHPVLRHGLLLLCVGAALVTVFLSGLINAHSVAWLVGIYVTAALFLEAWRRADESSLRRPFLLYLGMVNQYFLVVWALHVMVPGRDAAADQARVLFWAHLLGTGSIYVPIAVYHFALRLAGARALAFLALEAFGWALATFFFVCNLTGHFTLEYRWVGYAWFPTTAGTYGYYFWYTVVSCLLTIFVPAVQLFRLRDRQQRLRVAYFLVGFTLWVLTCMGHLLSTLGISLYPLGGFMFLFHILLLGYAVLWKRVYDVTIVLRRSLAYAVMSLILGMVYGGLLWASGLLLPRSQFKEMILPALSFVVLAGFLYAPLLAVLQRWLDRLFLRGEVNRQALLEGYAAEIAATIELEGVVRALCQVLQRGVNPRCVRLYLSDTQGRLALAGRYADSFEYASGQAAEGLPPAIEAVLSEGPVGPRVVNVRGRSAAQAPLAMGEGDEQLVVPVRHRDEVLGYAVLEPKRADEPYSPEDQRFADAVAAQSAVALLNARAFERIRQLQELNQRTLEGLSAGVLLLTRAGSVVLWNEAARGMLAAGSGASFPATLAEAKALQPQLVGVLEAALADGRARENAQLSLETPRRVFLLLSVRPLAQTGGEPLFLVLLHDLTAYKEMEATARRHEDLAKVGEMISAINHEIGNILQPVHTQLRKLDTGTAADEVLPHALPVLKDRIGALDRLLKDLKDLARPLELRVRAVNLTDLTDSVLSDIRELPVAEGIDFHVELAVNARECPRRRALAAAGPVQPGPQRGGSDGGAGPARDLDHLEPVG